MLEKMLIRPLRYLSAVTPEAVTNVPEALLAVFLWKDKFWPLLNVKMDL